LTQIESKKDDKITSEGLVESEEKFIKDLRNYLRANKTKFKNYEIYVLRNFSKSGRGFQLEWSQFFLDFILWVKNVNNNEQTINHMG
jgi:gamma-glutamyl phosphate reductase